MMGLRDDIERTLRSWDAYEKGRGAPPVVDFDCHPVNDQVAAAESRIFVRDRLTQLLKRAEGAGEHRVAERVQASLAYLDTLLGAQMPFRQYVQLTQGCDAVGWSADYVDAVGDVARNDLAAQGVSWDSTTSAALNEVEGLVAAADAPDVVREAAEEMDSAVRDVVGSDAPYQLSVEQVDLDAYWAYWLDGAGSKVRMRINLRNARFTQVQARMCALHEILGHGLQCAAYAQRCATDDVPWVRLTSVHSQQQVLLEGLAQALPLFLRHDDSALRTRVRLKHYLQLVNSELHLLVNNGTPMTDCVDHARRRVPFWTDEAIGDLLTDRGADPLLRSYLWAYPAGADWFVNLADHAPTDTVSAVLRAAYRDPLTPDDLARLWPTGPPIGGG
jgi:hypothetical protein